MLLWGPGRPYQTWREQPDERSITRRDQFEKRSSNQLATAKREELRGKKEVIVIVIVVERITRMTTDAKLFVMNDVGRRENRRRLRRRLDDADANDWMTTLLCQSRT